MTAADRVRCFPCWGHGCTACNGDGSVPYDLGTVAAPVLPGVVSPEDAAASLRQLNDVLASLEHDGILPVSQAEAEDMAWGLGITGDVPGLLAAAGSEARAKFVNRWGWWA